MEHRHSRRKGNTHSNIRVAVERGAVCSVWFACACFLYSSANTACVSSWLLLQQAYFSQVLDEQRALWDSSADIKAFFFPGPPTSYSAALSRQRSEQLKEVKKGCSHVLPFVDLSRLGCFFVRPLGGVWTRMSHSCKFFLVSRYFKTVSFLLI